MFAALKTVYEELEWLCLRRLSSIGLAWETGAKLHRVTRSSCHRQGEYSALQDPTC